MSQLFKKKDPRRRWRGYRIYFYPHEFIPPQNKSLTFLHLHFKGLTGELRIYLPVEQLRIEIKWGEISFVEQKEILKFVQKNYFDIEVRLEEELSQSQPKTRIIMTAQLREILKSRENIILKEEDRSKILVVK